MRVERDCSAIPGAEGRDDGEGEGQVASTQENHPRGTWKLHILKTSVNSVAFLELLLYPTELNYILFLKLLLL